MTVISETETMEQLAPRQFRVTSALGRKFYQDSAQQWKNIVAIPEQSVPGTLESTRNSFQIQQSLSDASWEWFHNGVSLRGKLIATGWLNWTTRERQIAAFAQNVPSTWVAGTDTIIWPGYFGTGLDLRWRHTRRGFKQEIVVTPAGRASLGTPPWGAADTALVVIEELTLPSAMALTDEDGLLFDGSAPMESLKNISLGDISNPVARFTADVALTENKIGKYRGLVRLRRRLVKENGRVFLISGERVNVLNAALGSANTWILDPSVDVAGDTRDGMWTGGSRPSTDERLNWNESSSGELYASNDGDNQDCAFAFAFAVTGPALADTINTCTLQVNMNGQSNNTNQDVEVRCGDTDDAAIFDTSHTHSVTMHFGALTTANLTWILTAGTGSKTSPSLVSLLQEIVDRPGWASGNFAGFVLIGEPMTNNQFKQFEAEIESGTDPATLTFTYTAAGGLSIPVAQHHRRFQGVV